MRSLGVVFSAAVLALTQVAYAAVIDIQPNLVLTKPDVPNALLNNTSLLANETISPPLPVLPDSPYYYRVPEDPAVTMIFYAFARPIPELSAVECMLEANEIVSIALAAALHDVDPDRVVPQDGIRTNAQHASLIVAPINRQLKWRTCSAVLKALRTFLNRWEYVRVTFVVEEEGMSVAIGELF